MQNVSKSHNKNYQNKFRILFANFFSNTNAHFFLSRALFFEVNSSILIKFTAIYK